MALTQSQVAFRVTTDVLRETSGTIGQKAENIEQYLNDMQEEVQMTSAYWEGEGGEICRNAFYEFRTRIETLVSRLREHVTDLEKIAGIYEENEKQAQQQADVLPDNVIV